MQSYPAWQPHFANPAKRQWLQVACPDGHTEDASDLAGKLLQWSPGRPLEFKLKAILAKAFHMEFVLQGMPTESNPISPPPSHHGILFWIGVWATCNRMFFDVP